MSTGLVTITLMITIIAMTIISITITMATIMRMRRGAIGAERRAGARSPHGP